MKLPYNCWTYTGSIRYTTSKIPTYESGLLMSTRHTNKQRQREYLAYQPLRPGSRTVEDSTKLLGPLCQLLSEHFEMADLTNRQRWDLAGVLLDFAIDVNRQTGLWASYEQYNRQWFGTPLPLTMEDEVSLPPGLHYERIRHLMWVMIPELTDGSPLSPADKELCQLSQVVHTFLNAQLHLLPKDNNIKAFLHTASQYAWDVKRKLVWLGTKSYLFRLFYRQYLQEQTRGEYDIGHTDDFICQQCTVWSGLGAIDILAGVLDVGENERNELRGWYERHAAPFLILSANREVLEARNIVNDRSYTIRMNDDNLPFRTGDLVIGSLTPWRGQWYWSGEQRRYAKPSASMMADLKQTMICQSPGLIYRYCPEREQRARQLMAQFHEEALRFYGTDLMVYPDGLTMAADWQREMRQKWATQSPEAIRDTIARHGMKHPHPDMSLPRELLDSKTGLGVFLNPEEGKEIMEHFHDLVEGFHRKGADLTEWQEEVILGFIFSESISPAFVQRVVEEYGDASLKTAFHLQDTKASYWLNYLLRRYKGHFFRKRYPAISVV